MALSVDTRTWYYIYFWNPNNANTNGGRLGVREFDNGAIHVYNSSQTDTTTLQWQILADPAAGGLWILRNRAQSEPSYLGSFCNDFSDCAANTRAALHVTNEADVLTTDSQWNITSAGSDRWYMQNLANSTVVPYFLDCSGEAGNNNNTLVYMNSDQTDPGLKWSFSSVEAISSVSFSTQLPQVASSSSSTASPTSSQPTNSVTSTTSDGAQATATSIESTEGSTIDSGSSNLGVKVGIPVGIVLGILLCAAAVFVVLSWRKRKRRGLLQRSDNETGVPLKPPSEYNDDRNVNNYILEAPDGQRVPELSSGNEKPARRLQTQPQEMP